MSSTQPKIAVIYDWASTGYGGAEKVLEAIRLAFPGCDFYTSFYNSKQAFWAKKFNPKVTFLQKFPFLFKFKPILALFMPIAFESIDLSAYQIVISVTSSFAKGVLTTPKQLHISYLLSPPRFLYSHQEAYTSSGFWQWPVIKQLLILVKNYLTLWDQTAALRPDYIIPISLTIQRRVRDYYHIESLPPIYPGVSHPINTPVPKLLAQDLPKNYFLVVSRLVKYKNTDLAILACKKLHKSLVIVGDGPELSYLVNDVAKDASVVRAYGQSLESFFEQAGRAQGQTRPTPKIFFVGSCSQSELSQLYQKAQALIMPQVEDFGITGLEAASYGKCVILQKESGVGELLEDQRQAVYSRGVSLSYLVEAIERFEKTTSFSVSSSVKVAKANLESVFIKKIQKSVAKLWKEKYEQSP